VEEVDVQRTWEGKTPPSCSRARKNTFQGDRRLVLPKSERGGGVENKGAVLSGHRGGKVWGKKRMKGERADEKN